MVKWIVLENRRPACYPLGDKQWQQYEYDSAAEALMYARDWLGMYLDRSTSLEVDKPFCYNGYDIVLVTRKEY